MEVIEKNGFAILKDGKAQYNAKVVAAMSQKQFKETFQGVSIDVHKACKNYYKVEEKEQDD